MIRSKPINLTINWSRIQEFLISEQPNVVNHWSESILHGRLCNFSNKRCSDVIRD